MKQAYILLVHGMGTQTRDFYKPFENVLSRYFTYQQKKQIHCFPIFFQDALEYSQERLWQRYSKENLSNILLRKFFFSNFSDATTYEYHKDEPESPYKKVHNKIYAQLENLKREINGVDAHCIMIASSLGSHIISNYVYDAQNKKQIWENKEQDSFHCLEFLKYFITVGCNIPFFVSGHDDIKPFIKKEKTFLWHNYYDKDDILGWPLKTLSPAYSNTVDKDIQIDYGFTPLGHGSYWTNMTFLNPISEYVKEGLRE